MREIMPQPRKQNLSLVEQMRLKLKGRQLLLIIFMIIIFIIYRFFFKTESSSYETNLKETKINVNELFEFGKCLLSEAGKKVVEIRHNDDLKTKNKVDKSVVTQADLISHQIIVHTLNAKFSNLNVVSEENSNVKNEVDVDYYMRKCDVYNKTPNDFYYSSNSLTVWIDPLDATQVFTLIEYQYFSSTFEFERNILKI
jgi:hypothetical protein